MIVSTDFEAFYSNMTSLLAQVKEALPLKVLRERAFDHFLELGLPEKSGGAFQYVPLKALCKDTFSVTHSHSFSKEEIEMLIYPEAKDSCLVFVNGFFDPTLSQLSALPKQVVVMPLGEAMRSYGTFLQNRWSKTLREDTDPFAILNLALHPQGAFIYVPPKVVCTTPIQCLFLTTDGGQLSLPRLQLFVASHAEIKLITSATGPGFSNSVIDVALEDSARFSCLEVSSSIEGRSFSAVKATLKRDSYLSALTLYPRRELTRHSFQIALIGENAEALVQGGWMLKGKEETHVHVLMRHEAPSCRSMQKFKGVLDDVSRSSFEGKIFVTPDAQKTEAYQLNNNLILGEHAVANSKPNLEIFADDVKASHGATVSELDCEQLFYLTSRGIPRDVAKNLLVQGFIGELIQQAVYPSIIHQELTHVKNSFL
ncbi:MAG: Fe-S cluster assembly protein SufD [Rhabdochlamydiaceae bacterium]|jgi:Fe-S cluster assembly protein SufD